jgi:hypothetical protein
MDAEGDMHLLLPRAWSSLWKALSFPADRMSCRKDVLI